MAEETDSSAKPHSGMTGGKRFAIGVNVLVQIAVLFVILGMVNFISFRRFVRWDFTRDQQYALSSQTKNLLGSLSKPVQAIVYFAGGPVADQINPDVMALLKEYEYASKRKVTVETVAPYRNFTRAKELSEKYKFGGEENVVILDYDGKSKFVNAAEMVEMDQGVNPFQPQAPQVKAFKGEAALTAAMLELVEGKPQMLYISTGHGEPDVKAAEEAGALNDAAALAEYLKRANVRFQKLKLVDVERVPEDATALMIFGPRQDLSEREIELLHSYWQNKGRVFVMLNGTAKTPRLDAWLKQSGVTPGAGPLMRMVTTVNMVNGERNTRILTSAQGEFDPAGDLVTKNLAGENAFFFGSTLPLQIDEKRGAAEQLQITKLASVGENYWSELDSTAGPAIPSQDPVREKSGPFTVAVAIEKGAMQGVKVETGRMLVVGNAAYLTDGGLKEFGAGLEFALHGINWLLNREQGVGEGIPPKEKKFVSLTLDEKRLQKLVTIVVFGMPGIVACFGLLSWLQRRR